MDTEIKDTHIQKHQSANICITRAHTKMFSFLSVFFLLLQIVIALMSFDVVVAVAVAVFVHLSSDGNQIQRAM